MKDFSVAIFPFLKTHAPIRIGGYDFRSTADLAWLREDQAAVIADLTSMLYLRDDVRIAHATYAIAEPLGAIRPGPVVERLEEIRAVVGYLYSSPHPILGDVYLPFDMASLAIVEPSDVSIHLVRPENGTLRTTGAPNAKPDAIGRIPGYQGVLNLRYPLWLASGSRLYGPKPNMFLNIAQDLSGQLGDQAASTRRGANLLFDLVDAPSSPFRERVLTALGWYNDASGDNDDPGRCLLHLAIAFETLLQLPRHEKTDRVVDAISLLLGRTDRLSEWAKQFYGARSRIVHEGRIRDWRFYAQGLAKNEKGPRFGSLMTYSRQIFQLCVETILTGARLAENVGLRERFIANSERYEEIATLLSAKDNPAADQLVLIQPIVAGLDRYRFVGDTGTTIEGLLKATKAAAVTLLACKFELERPLQIALEQLATSPSKQLLDSMTKLSQLDDAFKGLADPLVQEAGQIVTSLVDVAWSSLALTYFKMLEVRGEVAS